MKQIYFRLKVNGIYYKFHPCEIVYAEADGSYCHIITVRGKFTVSENLKHIHERLMLLGDFLRVHRSYCVNLAFVNTFSRDEGIRLIAPFDKDFSIPLSEEGEIELQGCFA